MKWKQRSACLVALAALAVGAAAPDANALVYSDIIDWNMCDSRVEAGGYTTSSGNSNGVVEFRWVDSPSHTTVVSANGYFNDQPFGTQTIPAGVTSYSTIGYRGGAGLQFRLWGRTAIGSGCMYNHDGRVNR